MKAQVSLKMGSNSKYIARALMDEAKDGLPKVHVERIEKSYFETGLRKSKNLTHWNLTR